MRSGSPATMNLGACLRGSAEVLLNVNVNVHVKVTVHVNVNVIVNLNVIYVYGSMYVCMYVGFKPHGSMHQIDFICDAWCTLITLPAVKAYSDNTQ